METFYDSPLGPITLVSDGVSLTELKFGKPQENGLGKRNLLVFKETCHWLDLYFQGESPNFMPKLSLKGSPFQQKVWQELLNINYGQTTTYGAIAKRIGCRSAQAVGQAIHRNPIAIIIPCHRVIGADGSLTGYASGLELKRKLLELEGITIFAP